MIKTNFTAEKNNNELFGSGLQEIPFDCLLDKLHDAILVIIDAWEAKLFCRKTEIYWEKASQYAPIALTVYDRLCARGEEPRLPVQLCINRYQSTGCNPDQIEFWKDPDAIRNLYFALRKDGYFRRNDKTSEVKYASA